MEQIIKYEEKPVLKEEFDNVVSEIQNTFLEIGRSIKQLLELQINTNKQIDILSTEVKGLKDQYTDLNDRMNTIEMKEEITTEQCNKIKTTACIRIYSILGEDKIDRQKYFNSFIRRLYSDAKKYSSLGNAISTTKKGDYQRVINYIEAWTPTGGISKLKREVDDNSKARKMVRELGYI